MEEGLAFASIMRPGTGAHLPNPPTKYIAWRSKHQYKAGINISYQKHRPRT
jgi:hypothetical protein